MLGGHEESVNSASFSPDGSRIVTASSDWTARIWDVTSGKEIAILRGRDNLASAAFSSDGTRVVTAASDRMAHIWDSQIVTMSARDLIAEVCLRRLRGYSKLKRDEMRLAGYSDDTPEIDACFEIE